jgi:hypothetical protein
MGVCKLALGLAFDGERTFGWKLREKLVKKELLELEGKEVLE